MALNKEYTRKVKWYIEHLPKRIYQPVGQFGFEGFFTYNRLSFAEACAHEREALPQDLSWGKKWEYAWLFSTITLPKSCKGHRIVMHAFPGECLVWVNGEIYGAFDKQHTHITLTTNAQGGETYNIVIEAYAGHAGIDDCLCVTQKVCVLSEEDLQEFPEDKNQQTLKNGTFGIMHEDVFGLWVDMGCLYALRLELDNNSMRAAHIDKGLRRVCNEVDIELPFQEFLAAAKKGREILKPLLDCKNGSTVPTMYAFGHSHLDLEWLWTVEETRRKTARTLGNQLQLMKEYPDYKYVQSQAWILQTVKNEYPELYEQVKQAVKEGKMIPEGSAWVEPDVNITSGESLVRQFIFGKRFYAEEFGVDTKIFWLPDSFGVTAALPQILQGCDIPYFYSAKLHWMYNDADIFPYSNFNWKGLDGTRVLAKLGLGYGSPHLSPDLVRRKWNQNTEKEDIPVQILPYGYSDGGGGSTRLHLEQAYRQKDLEDVPKVLHASPVDFFTYIEKNCEVNRSYVGELYFAGHRGTYTSQAKTKRLNRKCELGLHTVEFWSALLEQNTKAKTDALWQSVLFNQFHDTLPGSSITAVHELAEKDLTLVLEQTEALTNEVLQSVLTPQSNTLTLFNALGWERTAYLALPEGYTSATDAEGQAVVTQVIADKTYGLFTVPAFGSAWFTLGNAPAAPAVAKTDLVLQNEFLRAEFNPKGQLISLCDLQSGMEFLSAPSNVFKMFGDAPTMCDAWDIDSFYEELEISLPDAEIEPLFDGVLCSGLRITQKLHNSLLTQTVTLKQGSRQLDFETEVEWNETHKLLKVYFATDMHTEELISEIQFGHIKRPNHKNRQYDADRFEVWQHRWSALCEAKRGVALLNDGKYGISANGNTVGLTLLKSAAAPAKTADRGTQRFAYALKPFACALADSDVVQQGYNLNLPVNALWGKADIQTMLQVDQSNVIIDTVKLAEDGSGDLILRLYEAQNTQTDCCLTLGFEAKEIYKTNMLETRQIPLALENCSVALRLKAFEIVTLRIKR